MCDLILQRQQVDEWRIIYEIQQAEVKNNPDPEKSAVSGPYPCSRRCSQSQLQYGREGDKRFVYNSAAFLVVIAIADGVLYEVPAVDALWKKTIPAGETNFPYTTTNERRPPDPSEVHKRRGVLPARPRCPSSTS
jgi:hypothetical protein